MAQNKSSQFAQFLTKLAESKDSPVSSGVLDSLKAKLEKERAEKVEMKLRRVFENIEGHVSEIRRYRKAVRENLDLIEKLEKKAENIIAGKDDSDD